MDKGILTCCGESCILCIFAQDPESPCEGCISLKGQLFWGDCPVYACNAEKDITHCGVCKEFPCDKFINNYNPENPHGPRNAVVRVGLSAYRAIHGDEKTFELLKKIGEQPRE